MSGIGNRPINQNINQNNQKKGPGNVFIVLLIFLATALLFGFVYTLYFRSTMQYITGSGSSGLTGSGSSGLTEFGSVLSGLTGSTQLNISLFDQTDVDFVKQIVPEETLDNITKELSNTNYISDPNSPIQKDILLASSEDNYGTSLPWDRNVRSCDVLKNTDQDLYADVQDSRYVTMF
jgi:hypothetical protein